MILTFRPIKVRPEHWKPADHHRPDSPFRGTYRNTLELLDRELRQLEARDVSLQVDARPDQIRIDGGLRSDAKVDHPGVILTIETRQLGSLIYETDRYGRRWNADQAAWKENLRAIALGLEALRKVERYGIARRGQQYAGYRELGSGIPLAAGMTVEEAARFICANTDGDWHDDVEADPSFALSLYKDAAKLLHPDAGGDPAAFKRLSEARDVLRRSFPAAS